MRRGVVGGVEFAAVAGRAAGVAVAFRCCREREEA